MGIMARIMNRLVCNRRAPDRIIGGEDNPYLLRWKLLDTNYFSIYVHRFLRSDDDRALHDHPADSISLLLDGSYMEWLEQKSEYGEVIGQYYKVRRPWRPVARKAETMHRVQLYPTIHEASYEKPVTTLFFFFRRRRNWGFACKSGWRPWEEYCDGDDSGKVGRGCN